MITGHSAVDSGGGHGVNIGKPCAFTTPVGAPTPPPPAILLLLLLLLLDVYEATSRLTSVLEDGTWNGGGATYHTRNKDEEKGRKG